MNEEKIVEAQALSEDAQAEPGPIAEELRSEARELQAEALTEPDSVPSNDPKEAPEEIAAEPIEEEALGEFPGTAILPTGGLLEMGHVLDLLLSDPPEATNEPATTTTLSQGNQPTPEHPVYGSVYNQHRR